MKLDYSYCLNEGDCNLKEYCKRHVNNYSDEDAIILADNLVDYVNDKECISNYNSLMDWI